jgi:hypothetical protein
MARLIWALFCEDQTTGESGKNSYINVFDTMSVRVRRGDSEVPVSMPLSQPAQTSAFVLALNLTATPGAPQCTVHIRDNDGHDILGPMQSRLPDSPDGRHNLHLRFTHGIPVRKSGIYTFDVSVDGEACGQAQIPVSVEWQE